MTRYPDGSYMHRGMIIQRDEIGITITGGPFAMEYVYKTIADARKHIDMIKGCGTGERPQIIGKWLDLAIAKRKANQ